MINNLDNPALLENALRRVDKYGKWYVDYMSQERQIGVRSIPRNKKQLLDL